MNIDCAMQKHKYIFKPCFIFYDLVMENVVKMETNFQRKVLLLEHRNRRGIMAASKSSQVKDLIVSRKT